MNVLEFSDELWSEQDKRGDDDESHEREDERVFHHPLPAAVSKDVTEHAAVLSWAARVA
jgi:hypothetical protein